MADKKTDIMTKDRLKQYRPMQTEIKYLEYKLSHQGKDGNMVGNSVIMDYRSGYPHPQTVIGVDLDEVKKNEKRLDKLKKESKKIEKFIEEIEDSRTKSIFCMAFLDGEKQEQIGKMVHLERSRISKEIDKYLKVAHKAQKAHV